MGLEDLAFQGGLDPLLTQALLTSSTPVFYHSQATYNRIPRNSLAISVYSRHHLRSLNMELSSRFPGTGAWQAQNSLAEAYFLVRHD